MMTYKSWELGSTEVYVGRENGLWTVDMFVIPPKLVSHSPPSESQSKLQITKFLSLGHDDTWSYFQYSELTA